MRKSWLIAVIIVLLLIIGVITGIYSYQKENAKDSNPKGEVQLAGEENKQIGTIRASNVAVETSASQVKISPNAVITEKQYYTGCDHLKKEDKEVPSYLVNRGEEDLQAFYPNWKIEDFTASSITLYRENTGYCDEHYVIKPRGEVLAVYTLDENGKEVWKEDTEIQIMYLPPEDLEKIQAGIKAIGDAQLNSILEDYE